jgi:hypothetical protein
VRLPPLQLKVHRKPEQQFSFAFITLQSAEDMALLQQALHLKKVQGCYITCCVAQDKGWRPPWQPVPKVVPPPKRLKTESADQTEPAAPLQAAREPSQDQLAGLRRLFFEAHTLALTDVRLRAEASPDPSQATRKLPTAERVARQKAQQARLGGLVFNPNTLPSNHLVDLFVDMVETGLLTYIKQELC